MTLAADSRLWEAFAAQARERYGPARRRWATPGDLAQHLDPRTSQTRALDLIDAALVRLVDTSDGRLLISMPPQEGKSTRVAKDFPTWMLHQDPDQRIVCASYGQGLANRNGRAIRNNITMHPELGLEIAPDNGAVHEWQIKGYEGGVLSVGVGAGLTGRPADLLVIDDPIKDRKEADSETFRENNWLWWTDVASTRLAPGASVVVILTRWHEADLAGMLLAAEDGHLWDVINIPAEADHDPEKGEVDQLGRDPGEFMDSARGRTVEQWEAIKVRSGSRTWASLYQGRPSPAGGNIFMREWWKFYDYPLAIQRNDGSMWVHDPDVEIIQSWDMAFKDKPTSDFVCGQVWMRRGVDCFLLDMVHARLNFPATCDAFRALSAKWPQALLKIVEDAANGPAVIASLARIVAGIVPETPQGSKVARAEAVTPLIEAGNVFLPAFEMAPWVGDFIEECSAFPNGANDDIPDATSQALNRLVIRPLMAGEDLYEPDIYSAADRDGFSISPY